MIIGPFGNINDDTTNSNIEVANNITTYNLLVNGVLTVSGSHNITANIPSSLGLNNLTVSGLATISGLSVSENINVSGNLNVSGTTYINILTVSGSHNINENITSSLGLNNLTVSGLATISGLSVSGNAVFHQNINISGNLNVSGTTYINILTVSGSHNITATIPSSLGLNNLTVSLLSTKIGITHV